MGKVHSHIHLEVEKVEFGPPKMYSVRLHAQLDTLYAGIVDILWRAVNPWFGSSVEVTMIAQVHSTGGMIGYDWEAVASERFCNLLFEH